MRQTACTWLVVVTALGCDAALPGKPDPADRPKTPAQITSFEYLFAHNCAGCHGAEGKLGPAPPLADPLFLAIVSDDDLVRVITDGRSGTPMPAFARKHQGTLTDEQIQIVAAGLRERWKADRPPGEKLPEYAVVASREPAVAEIERGTKVFERACAECHGARGEGMGPDESPGRINDPALLSLMSNQGLRRIVITGRHDLGMPDYAGDAGRARGFEPLSSAEIADVVALLASWRAQRD
jgi:mono/diheme cytochrome c family protein